MGTPLCHPCKTPLDCPGGTACDNACCYVYAGTGPLKRNAVANSIITSLCIILSFSYDKEELKASPPPIFVDLCGGSDKICCFYAGMILAQNLSPLQSMESSTTKMQACFVWKIQRNVRNIVVIDRTIASAVLVQKAPVEKEQSTKNVEAIG